MFKKLRDMLSGKDGPEGPGDADAAAEFIAVMESFEKTSQPFHELAEKARAHAEKVAETGKLDHRLSSRLEEALKEIRATELQVEETREAAGDLSEAALARFETTAGRIGDVRGAIEEAIRSLKLARIEFESLREDDDDYDDDFDGD